MTLLALIAPALLGAAAPQDAVFARLHALCSKAFAGRVVSTDPADADFADKPLVMHVRDCSASELRVPFHVGTDRSRTWVITRTATGLRLKHDHRHEDGTPDATTLYGGDTTARGTERRQEFPVDAESIAMFRRAGNVRSTTNVWAIEVDATRFAYELRRPGRKFRVEFDLTRPITAPPPPWGSR